MCTCTAGTRGSVAAKRGCGTLTGVTAFASWRGAYLSKQVSVQNMILIPMFWFKSWLFGRDISRF